MVFDCTTPTSVARAFCVAVLLIPLPVLSLAQQQPRGGLNDPRPLQDFFVSYQTAPGTGVLIFSVYAERTTARLDRQALLKLVNRTNNSATWQTTEDSSKGVFTNVPFGSYEVEISAVGYLSTHQEIQVMNSLRPAEIDVVLHRDPDAINLDTTAAIMTPKARKEAKRAVSLLKSGDFTRAQKELDQAYKLAPSSPELNFLLGYLYFQKKDFAQAGTYLQTAANLDPRNAQTLTLLGRVGLEREDYAVARSALEQAVLVDDENWLPHNLLADSYLRQKSYDKAREEAQVAIDKGKSAAGPAQLVLGQALFALGQQEEGLKALNLFLQECPRHPMAGQVRGLIDWIQARSSQPAVVETASNSEMKAPGVDPLAALPSPGLTVKSWQPPGIDEMKPAIAAAVTCPTDQVIEQSGLRVQELVADVARFAAVEDLFHQSLDRFGVPVRTETRKYNYVAAIAEPQPGFLDVDEYRSGRLELSGYPDNIASNGFAALALVFHPDMRDNFEMTCEGLGDWHGQASWLVHFRQRTDRPNRMHSYKVGNEFHPVSLKGRAWITADNFQIVRIEAEMVNPMPEIQLLSEHQVVEYGPIPFPKKHTTLWLPKSAEIYFDFRKHRYYRRHSFDHYMLYSVDTEEHPKVPKPKTES